MNANAEPIKTPMNAGIPPKLGFTFPNATKMREIETGKMTAKKNWKRLACWNALLQKIIPKPPINPINKFPLNKASFIKSVDFDV